MKKNKGNALFSGKYDEYLYLITTRIVVMRKIEKILVYKLKKFNSWY